MPHLARRPGIALWGGWLVAGTVGSVLPVLPAALNLRWPMAAGLGLEDAFGLSSIAVTAFLVAFLEAIVLGGVTSRFSGPVLMWAPVSAAATIAAFLAIVLWGNIVPRSLISVSAIQAALPPAFPLLPVIFALFGIANAVVLGIAQGVLLSRIFGGRSVIGLWLAASVGAAVVVGVVFGIRLQEPAPGNEAALTAIFLSNTLIDGALYSAVTGAALVAIAGWRKEVLTQTQT
jgi:hypothetical protein